MIFAEILINSLSILTICGFIMIIRHKKGITGSWELLILSCFMLEWAMGSFFEEAVNTLAMKTVWRNITQIGTFYTPAAVLMFSIAYSGILYQYRKTIAKFVYFIQTCSILFILTDQWHHLARIAIYIKNGSLIVVTSIWDQVLISFNFVYMAISITLMFIFVFLSVKNMRKQVFCVILGMLVIVAYSLIKVSTNGLFGISIPISGIFVLGELFMLLGVARYDLAMVTPIARNEAINIMNDGIIILTAEKKIIDANPAALQIFKQAKGAENKAVEIPFLDTLLKNSYPEWYDTLLNGRTCNLEITSNQGNDQRYFFCESYEVKNKHRKIIGSFTTIKDITQQRKNQDQLIRMAEMDGLTGIYNRRAFINRVETILKEYNGRVCLLFLDMDYFKQINDQYGHAAGDTVLIEFCRHVEAQLPGDILFGRMGGEEFALFCIMNEEERMFQMAEELRRSIEYKQFLYHDLEIKVTISLGIAYGNYHDFNRLYNIADVNLYKAKELGRNRIVV
jgi:diguanylate cyclase (GGDEF) domain